MISGLQQLSFECYCIPEQWIQKMGVIMIIIPIIEPMLLTSIIDCLLAKLTVVASELHF